MSDNYEWVKWESKFELGIPDIDAQHKKLVDLCNKLYVGLIECKSNLTKNWQSLLSETIREMADYTKTHLAYEEKLLATTNYDKLAEHKIRHKEFTDKVTEILQNFNAANMQTTVELSQFLREWFLSHIACEDKLYVSAVKAYLKNKQ